MTEKSLDVSFLKDGLSVDELTRYKESLSGLTYDQIKDNEKYQPFFDGLDGQISSLISSTEGSDMNTKEQAILSKISKDPLICGVLKLYGKAMGIASPKSSLGYDNDIPKILDFYFAAQSKFGKGMIWDGNQKRDVFVQIAKDNFDSSKRGSSYDTEGNKIVWNSEVRTKGNAMQQKIEFKNPQETAQIVDKMEKYYKQLNIGGFFSLDDAKGLVLRESHYDKNASHEESLGLFMVNSSTITFIKNAVLKGTGEFDEGFIKSAIADLDPKLRIKSLKDIGPSMYKNPDINIIFGMAYLKYLGNMQPSNEVNLQKILASTKIDDRVEDLLNSKGINPSKDLFKANYDDLLQDIQTNEDTRKKFILLKMYNGGPNLSMNSTSTTAYALSIMYTSKYLQHALPQGANIG